MVRKMTAVASDTCKYEQVLNISLGYADKKVGYGHDPGLVWNNVMEIYHNTYADHLQINLNLIYKILYVWHWKWAHSTCYWEVLFGCIQCSDIGKWNLAHSFVPVC